MLFKRCYLKAVSANVRKSELVLSFTLRLDKETFATAKELSNYPSDQWVDVDVHPHQLPLIDDEKEN